jgi:hypothetical protein
LTLLEFRFGIHVQGKRSACWGLPQVLNGTNRIYESLHTSCASGRSPGCTSAEISCSDMPIPTQSLTASHRSLAMSNPGVGCEQPVTLLFSQQDHDSCFFLRMADRVGIGTLGTLHTSSMPAVPSTWLRLSNGSVWHSLPCCPDSYYLT